MGRFNTIFWKAFLGLAGVLFIASFMQPMVDRAGGSRDRRLCQSQLKQIALAVRQYCADYDEQMPSLQTLAGWRDAVAPYARSVEVFHCPSFKNDSDLTDYWFNARLSGAHRKSMNHPAKTLMLGDGYSTSDPRIALSELPALWRTDDLSPAQRHLGGANYAFADGHVKWFTPDKISSQAPSRDGDGKPTFAVR